MIHIMHLVKFDLEADFQVKFIVQYDICVGTLLCVAVVVLN